MTISFRKLATNLQLSLVSVVIALALLEGVVRTFYPQSDFFSRSDDTIGVIGIPNLSGMMHDPEFTTHVTTNSYGFRDKERTVEKPPGTKRVLVLGDSFTEGLQVELEQTYCALLEQTLQERLGPEVELVCMGLPGVGTSHELRVYKNYGVRFSPDVVLVAWFSGNDLCDNHPSCKYYYPGFKPGPGPDELVPVAPRVKQVGSDGILGQIVHTNRLQLLSFMARAYRRFWLVKEAQKTKFALAPPPLQAPPGSETALALSDPFAGLSVMDAEMWEITRRIFKRLGDETREHGVTLVVGMIPSREELDGHPTGRRLAVLLGQLGIPCVDLAPALRAARSEKPDELLYFPIDSHFTARGHVAIVLPLADLIAPMLSR